MHPQHTNVLGVYGATSAKMLHQFDVGLLKNAADWTELMVELYGNTAEMLL